MKKIFSCMVVFFASIVLLFAATTEARYNDINAPDLMPCYNCDGSGVCPNCGGRGEVIFERWEDEHIVQDIFPCDACYGNGQCQICYGSGML